EIPEHTTSHNKWHSEGMPIISMMGGDHFLLNILIPFFYYFLFVYPSVSYIVGHVCKNNEQEQ
ncbi:MAG: hypothetical protein ACP5F1_05160, partial [Thermoplasmata archaeon]